MLIEKVLYGFYESGEASADELALEAFVRKHLPYYSVPERWVHVDSIPLTANGKVDRQHLGTLVNHMHWTRVRSGVEVSSSERKHASVEANLEIQRPRAAMLGPLEWTMEKGKVVVTTQSSELSAVSLLESVDQATDILPEKHGLHGLRWLRHRAFMLYRRFYSVVVLSNIAVASFVLYTKTREQETIIPALGIATASNLVVAILMRSEPIVNLLFTIFCSVPVRLDYMRENGKATADCIP
jgi:hypothetical protein